MTSSDFTPADIKRFWSKVAIPDNLFGCWIWTISCSKRGYGQFQIKTIKRINAQAHKVAWVLTYGSIPPETPCVCHNCPDGDNPRCVNPAHLFLGTHADNMRDMVLKGRSARGSKKYFAKLHENDIPKIREMISNRVADKVIAKEFGVWRQTIGRIRLNRIWKHVK